MNYIEIISEVYPGIGVTCHTEQCDYQDLIWDNVVIPKEELDLKKIETISLILGQFLIVHYRRYE